MRRHQRNGLRASVRCFGATLPLLVVAPLLLISLEFKAAGAFLPAPTILHGARSLTLFETSPPSSDANKGSKPKVLGRKEGVYVRPSAAIERGSGFFVPGLEGGRVRVAAGVLLLLATVVNHVLSTSTESMSTANQWAEAIAILQSIWILTQAALVSLQSQVMVGNEKASATLPSAKASNSETVQQDWWRAASDASVDDTIALTWRNRVKWTAGAFENYLSACRVGILEKNQGILYWSVASAVPDENVSQSASQAAIETVQNSKSGRVALPAEHPIVQQLIPTSTTTTSDVGCVILQSLPDQERCLFVASKRSLASLQATRDLAWFGQLAKYLAPC